MTLRKAVLATGPEYRDARLLSASGARIAFRPASPNAGKDATHIDIHIAYTLAGLSSGPAIIPSNFSGLAWRFDKYALCV